MKKWLMVGTLALSGAMAQKANVVIPTGSTGGVFFYYGTSLAEILSKHGNVNATSLQTGGSYDNLLLMRDRTAGDTYYCALATTDAAFSAYTGQEPRFQTKKADMARTLFAMYPSFIHIVTTEGAKIVTVQSLKGKKVSTGQPGSSTENLALLVMEGAGMKADDFSKRERLGAKESAEALASGAIDAYFWVGGVPTGSIVETAQTLSRKGQKMSMISLSPDSVIVKRILRKYPGLVETDTVKKSVYGTSTDTKGLAPWNLMMCPASMPDDVAYNITKTVFENIKELQTAVKAALDTTPQNAVKFANNKGGAPYHPGALKYFKEKGWLK